ncbi:MAG: hypothetical protein U0805_22695 [Pirellulales bacterium]
MIRDRSQLVVVGGGAVGAVLLAFVLAYGQPPQVPPGSGGGSNGGPSGGGGPHGESPGPAGGGHGGRNQWPVYQRHPGDWRRRSGDWRGYGNGRSGMMPQISSGWFQRPYPYHLDYYKMRWGGSYAPYFGNLYGVPFGTPQVVNGGWGPGAGAWGAEAGLPQGYEWMDNGSGANGVAAESARRAADVSASGASSESQPTAGESLPAPVK